MENRILLTNNSGPALALDGVNDYARAPDHSSLDLGTGAGEDFTIETSFYVSDPAREVNQILIFKTNAYGVFFNDNGLFAQLATNTSGGNLQIFHLQPLSIGWHHVAAVFDNEFTASQDLFALYFDGQLAASTTATEFTPGILNSSSALYLGANNGARPFSGWMDETRFSDSVRYSGATYTVPTMPFTSDGNTRALWHFDETIGSTTFIDASPNGNTLTGINEAHTSIPPGDPNTPPEITSPDIANVPENTKNVLTVTATDVDLPPQTVTFSIVGGDDLDKFSITPGGALSFNSPPNYEAPTDSNTNNIYLVTVQANDGNGGTDTQTISVTVTDVNEGDYNLNRTVDAADYVMWRQTLDDIVTAFSGADGNGNGIVDQADYDVWRANFGNTLPPVGSGSTAISTISLAEPVAPNAASADEVANRPVAMAALAIDTGQPPSAPAVVITQSSMPQSDGPRLTRRHPVLVAELHDNALVAWLTSRRAGPRHDLAASDFADLRSESDNSDSSSQLDNALKLAFASLAD